MNRVSKLGILLAAASVGFWTGTPSAWAVNYDSPSVDLSGSSSPNGGTDSYRTVTLTSAGGLSASCDMHEGFRFKNATRNATTHIVTADATQQADITCDHVQQIVEAKSTAYKNNIATYPAPDNVCHLGVGSNCTSEISSLSSHCTNCNGTWKGSGYFKFTYDPVYTVASMPPGCAGSGMA